MEGKKRKPYYNREHQAKYKKTGTRKYTLELVKTTDADLIVWLDSQENKQGYIKQLIRDDITRYKTTHGIADDSAGREDKKDELDEMA